MAVSSGRRVQIEVGRYSGAAGMQTHDGVTTIAFMGEPRQFRGVATALVDGMPVRIADAARSAYVAGMVVLTVEPVQ